MVAGVLAGLVATGCGTIRPNERAEAASTSPSASPSTAKSTKEPEEYVGFHPQSRPEGDNIVMPLTFVDGTSGEAVAPSDLGIQTMSAAIYTAAGLGGVDRTIDFLYRDGSTFMHEGPLETYKGVNGSPVELWKPVPHVWGRCPNLIFRFGAWFVGVRNCQDKLSDAERKIWARLLTGEVTNGGFLVLSAAAPLQLQETGGHEGSELILREGRANWIEMAPGKCDPKQLPDDGDIRTMADGTRVSFSRVGTDTNNWFAQWCEEGLVEVQVSQAFEDFALAAADDFRLRDIVLAP